MSTLSRISAESFVWFSVRPTVSFTPVTVMDEILVIELISPIQDVLPASIEKDNGFKHCKIILKIIFIQFTTSLSKTLLGSYFIKNRANGPVLTCQI